MKILFALIMLFCSLASGAVNRLRVARECCPRKGLPNFFTKCQKGGTVRIAYLGGSITAQNGWRVQSLELLQSLYPKVEFVEIDAAIGGTGSDLGVYRLEHDVLKHKPDLLFVEFATNDNSIPINSVSASMEGIVRNTWSELPECDICFVYTITEKFLSFLKSGTVSEIENLHEDVADYYGIPSINFGVEITRLQKLGKLQMKTSEKPLQQVAGKELDVAHGISLNSTGKIPFSPDGVHPYLDSGHKLYTAAIERSLPLLEKAGQSHSHHDSLPDSLNPDYVRNVTVIPMTEARLVGDWVDVTQPDVFFQGKDFARFVPSVWKAAPGSNFSLKFTGGNLMLYVLYGPGAGAVEITLNGQRFKKIFFDPWSRYWRLYPVFLKGAELPDRAQNLQVVVLDEDVDKQKILSSLSPDTSFDERSESYASTDLLIGAVCIEDGKVVAE